jgi:hypothetical protein
MNMMGKGWAYYHFIAGVFFLIGGLFIVAAPMPEQIANMGLSDNAWTAVGVLLMVWGSYRQVRGLLQIRKERRAERQQAQEDER